MKCLLKLLLSDHEKYRSKIDLEYTVILLGTPVYRLSHYNLVVIVDMVMVVQQAGWVWNFLSIYYMPDNMPSKLQCKLISKGKFLGNC